MLIEVCRKSLRVLQKRVVEDGEIDAGRAREDGIHIDIVRIPDFRQQTLKHTQIIQQRARGHGELGCSCSNLVLKVGS